jgi:imidazolonepropionase
MKGGRDVDCDRLWINARLATMAPGTAAYGQIADGAIAAREGRIVFVGPRADLPAALSARETIDCGGRWITPGLIDCHTHLVHAGHRANEFELRLKGASYEEIARAGGGIVSTVKATRAASEDDLVASALPRLDALLAEGATTVEIKSGYGLELATEHRQLSAARRLARERPVDVVTTFLGAHALPPEVGGDKGAYIDQVCDEMIPAIAAEGLADAVDAFCEGIAFSSAQVARVF